MNKCTSLLPLQGVKVLFSPKSSIFFPTLSHKSDVEFMLTFSLNLSNGCLWNSKLVLINVSFSTLDVSYFYISLSRSHFWFKDNTPSLRFQSHIQFAVGLHMGIVPNIMPVQRLYKRTCSEVKHGGHKGDNCSQGATCSFHSKPFFWEIIVLCIVVISVKFQVCRISKFLWVRFDKKSICTVALMHIHVSTLWHHISL